MADRESRAQKSGKERVEMESAKCCDRGTGRGLGEREMLRARDGSRSGGSGKRRTESGNWESRDALPRGIGTH